MTKRVTITDDSIVLGVCGLPKRLRGGLHVAMLEAFLDDSGSGGDSPYCVVAGYMGTGREWAKFTTRWQEALDLEPQIDYFKMSEAESRRGQFWGWSPEDRDVRVGKFVEVVSRSRLSELSCAVSVPAYNKILRWNLPEAVRSPYFMCISGVMAALKSQLPMGDRVALTFDEQGSFEKFTVGTYGELKRLPGFASILAGVAHRDDKITLPLQAADLVAWQQRRFLSTDERPRAHYAELRLVGGIRVTLTELMLRGLSQNLGLIG